MGLLTVPRKTTCMLLLWLSCAGSHAADNVPIADVHLHFNPDQAEVTDEEDALMQLTDNNVLFGVVSSKPPSLALDLVKASGGWIIPYYMPYLEPERKRDWYFDERVLPAAREALASGQYRGLGEMHLIVGFAPSLKKPHPVIDGMLDLAEEFRVPVNIHAEASSYLYFLPLCLRHPEVKIQWAHAGSVLPPQQVATLMRACPNVWVDMSARDHMRYGKLNPIVDEQGLLLPGWQQFVIEFQDRVMIGSDPYYVEADATWDTPNTGWKYVGEILDFHRRWMSGLPRDVQVKVAMENALRFYAPLAEQAIMIRREKHTD